ncbi:hypothetical protein F5880DRAFT_1619677 [Lentinula raphanica]|nr:hypothetical protein F5880DRAFT_1619677 [Lentinula raphanica]
MTTVLPNILKNAIQAIRSNTWVIKSKSARAIVVEELERDEELRCALEEWIDENMTNVGPTQKYPDGGTLLDVHTTTMLALVRGDANDVETVLTVYETLLSELKVQCARRRDILKAIRPLQQDYLAIPPPRNLFQLNGSIAVTFNTDENDKVLDLSDMSDLTDLSESGSDTEGVGDSMMK